MELGAALRSEVPARSDSFWANVDQRFAAADDDSAVTFIDLDMPAGDTSRRRSFAVWTLALAAAVVLIAGLFVGNRVLTSNDGTVDAGFADDQEVGDSASDSDPKVIATSNSDGPMANFDHWHAVYGVWDCTASDGAGDWVPAFQSDRDDAGIHSHQDGLIHIHPFFNWSEGENAKLGLWAEAMGIVITDDTLVLDNGRVLREGETCSSDSTEPVVLHLRRWALDVDLLDDPSTPPTVITSNLSDERFFNDREVWTIAYAPLGAEIPLPPVERFDTLRNVTPLFDPDADPVARLTPPVTFDSGVDPQDQLADEAMPVPTADIYGRVELLEIDPDALAELEESTGTTIGATTLQRFGAASTDGLSTELNYEFYLYTADDDGSANGLVCSAVFHSSQPRFAPMKRCDDEPVEGLQRTQISGSSTGSEQSGFAMLTDIAPEGRWLVLEMAGGRTAVSNVANNVSFVSWSGLATVIRAQVLDASLVEIWSEDPPS